MGLIGGDGGLHRPRPYRSVLDNRARALVRCVQRPGQAKPAALRLRHRRGAPTANFKEMAAAEAKRADKGGLPFSVATPEPRTFEIAKTFAEAGFNVICDKPLTFDLKQAEDLMEVVKKTGVVFGVTHNYTGRYPLVRQAQMV